MTEREFTLAEMAAAALMTPRNVRAYQTRGLLLPPWRRGRRVVYGTDHLARLRLVRALHERGMSLGAVRSLIERGTAEHELNRMLREDLDDPGDPDLVPIQAGMVELVEQVRPGFVDELVACGLCVRRDGHPVADAALLSLVNSVYSLGLSAVDVVDVCLTAARAGAATSDTVWGLGPDADATDDEADDARDDATDDDGPEADGARRDRMVAQLAGAAFVRGLLSTRRGVTSPRDRPRP